MAELVVNFIYYKFLLVYLVLFINICISLIFLFFLIIDEKGDMYSYKKNFLWMEKKWEYPYSMIFLKQPGYVWI